MPWDGYLKYFQPKPEFKERRKEVYTRNLLTRFNLPGGTFSAGSPLWTGSPHRQACSSSSTPPPSLSTGSPYITPSHSQPNSPQHSSSGSESDEGSDPSLGSPPAVQNKNKPMTSLRSRAGNALHARRQLDDVKANRRRCMSDSVA